MSPPAFSSFEIQNSAVAQVEESLRSFRAGLTRIACTVDHDGVSFLEFLFGKIFKFV